MLAVIRTSVFYSYADDSNDGNFHTPTVGGISRAEAQAYIKSIHRADVTGLKFMVYFYDGMWAAALMLNRTVEKMKEIGESCIL